MRVPVPDGHEDRTVSIPPEDLPPEYPHDHGPDGYVAIVRETDDESRYVGVHEKLAGLVADQLGVDLPDSGETDDAPDMTASDADDDTSAPETYTPVFDPGAFSVRDLRDELDARDLSTDELVTLKAAESQGQDRDTALEAIQSHIDE